MKVEYIVLLVIMAIFPSIFYFLLKKIQAQKVQIAYIKWQLDWYKEQNEKLYKILLNKDEMLK